MGTAADGGKGFKGRAASGDGPSGAVRCRPTDSTASYQTPPFCAHRQETVVAWQWPAGEGKGGVGGVHRQGCADVERMGVVLLPLPRFGNGHCM